jgi:septal ring factor EnvC (AmiA/AmiB activator)
MKVYSIVAGKHIEVPDRVAPVQSVVGDGHRRVAMELASLLLEAEKQITDLTTKLTAETAARKDAERCAAEEGKECDNAEKALDTERQTTATLRIQHATALGAVKTELATAQGAIATEKALRVAAEKATAEAEARCKALMAVPKPAPVQAFDMGAIQKTIRDALASNKPAKSQYEVVVGDRDANGRISKFNFKPK